MKRFFSCIILSFFLLLLPAGQAEPALADDGLEPLRQPLDKAARLRLFRDTVNHLAGDIGRVKGDICVNRIGKEKDILENVRKLVAQIVEVVVADILAVDFDTAFRDVVNADERLEQDTLARACAAHYADLFAARYAQIDIL